MPNRILVVRLDAIGDLVMTTLIFRELKRCFPGSTVTAVVQHQNRSLLETNPYVDRILSPPRINNSRLLRGLRQDLAVVKLYRTSLRAEPIDLVVNPRVDGDLYSADVLLKLVDSRRTFKYEDTSKKGIAGVLKRFAFRKMVNLPRPQPRQEVLSTIAITERMTGAACSSRPEIFLTASDVGHSEEIFASISPGTTIVCISFGAQAMRRAWPLERWAEVVRLLSLDRNVFALVLCAPSDSAAGIQLQSMLSVPNYLLNRASLRQVAAAIKASNLFLGPDSGLAHLAAAVDCPTIVVSPHPLSGDPDHGNSPIRFGPYSARARVAQPEYGLAPCVTGCDAITPHCILQILPEQVASTAAAMLDSCGIAGEGSRWNVPAFSDLHTAGK